MKSPASARRTRAKQEPVKLPHFIHDKRGRYLAARSLTPEQIIKAAVVLMNLHIERGDTLTSPDIVRGYLKAQLVGNEHEVFAVLFLDNQHRPLAFEEMFRGTIDGASVYPREVAKRCLQLNAAAVIFAHNHPSGHCEPSNADKSITSKLKEALNLFDVRTLDHFIVGDGEPYSFAEHGLI